MESLMKRSDVSMLKFKMGGRQKKLIVSEIHSIGWKLILKFSLKVAFMLPFLKAVIQLV